MLNIKKKKIGTDMYAVDFLGKFIGRILLISFTLWICLRDLFLLLLALIDGLFGLAKFVQFWLNRSVERGTNKCFNTLLQNAFPLYQKLDLQIQAFAFSPTTNVIIAKYLLAASLREAVIEAGQNHNHHPIIVSTPSIPSPNSMGIC